MTSKGTTGRRRRIGLAIAATGLALSALALSAVATVEPGTPGPDVTVGRDNDNAANPFIQPPGVVAKQHMDNTDVLFGRAGGDLLVGRQGADTLLGGDGPDIMIGGPEGGRAPNSDVLVGDAGDDINVWAPGDGSDAYVGDAGYDTMVFAPFVTNPNGSLKYEYRTGRWVPRVDISGKPQFSCRIVRIPAAQRLGSQFLVRFFVGGTLAVTVRQKDVERVLCPSRVRGYALAADLRAPVPVFRYVPLRAIGGTLGAIVAAP